MLVCKQPKGEVVLLQCGYIKNTTESNRTTVYSEIWQVYGK